VYEPFFKCIFWIFFQAVKSMVQFSGSSIVSILISVLILFVLIFNVIYIGGVKNALAEGAVINLSPGAASFIFWVDIILIVLVFLYLVYIMFIIFTTKEKRAGYKETFIRSQSGLGSELYMPKQP